MGERYGKPCVICNGRMSIKIFETERDPITLKLIKVEKWQDCTACFDGFTATAEDYLEKYSPELDHSIE